MSPPPAPLCSCQVKALKSQCHKCSHTRHSSTHVPLTCCPQVKALKSQCRERSHMLWTQLRMSYEGGLREQLHQGEQVIVAEMKELEIQLQGECLGNRRGR